MIRGEVLFKIQAKRHGWTVLRPGWPDFLCLDQFGTMFAVEVKDRNDWVSQRQRDTFEMLTRHSDFVVKLWRPDTPKIFVEWERCRGIRNGRGAFSRNVVEVDWPAPESGPAPAPEACWYTLPRNRR